jgi:DNA-binding NarL/FixJ family response regulator
MDLQLPGMSGIETTRAIVAAHPDVRALVLTLLRTTTRCSSRWGRCARIRAQGHRRGSPKTVANNVSAIFATLQVADRAQAMVRAREAGLGT